MTTSFTTVLRHRSLTVLAALTAGLAACDEDDPMGLPADAVVSVQALDFGDVELNFGDTGARTFTITNGGGAALEVTALSVTGPFTLATTSTPGTVQPGGSLELGVIFTPTGTGSASGSVEIVTNDPDDGSISIPLSANAGSFTYTQVDREGIPTLNTVFNHPPAFSKTAYNVAGPDGDLATYRGQFETVLGAVGNADPEGTAALLLPDALPVNLAAGATSFATLTGRALADDAVDVALFVTVGAAELQSDNVDANDVAFLTAFPYLAPAN